MKHTLALIKHRLSNIDGTIKQHKSCIENNIEIVFYEENLKVLETEQTELKAEYDKLVRYIIDNNDYK
jgi:hypothetical protein